MADRPATSFRFRITRPGFIFLALTLSFGLQAVLTGNNLLFLLFALMGGFGLSLALVTMTMPWRIGARRWLPEAAYAGEDFNYTVELRNQRRHGPAYGLQIVDQYVPRDGSGVVRDLAWLGPGQTLVLSYRVACPSRGWLSFAGLRLRCDFPFGLFEADRFVPVESRLLVYPQRWWFHRPLHLLGLEGANHQANHSHRFTVDGTDFAGLREFRQGDHPRQIHWHASGRFPNQILARQFEPPRDGRFVIVLDSFYRREEEARQRAAFEDQVCLALALIEKLLADQFAVTFVGWSTKPQVFHLNPVSAKLSELRGWLASIQPEPDRTLSDLLSRVRLSPQARGILLRLPGTPEPMTALPQWLQFTPDHLKPFAAPRRPDTQPLASTAQTAV